LFSFKSLGKAFEENCSFGQFDDDIDEKRESVPITIGGKFVIHNLYGINHSIYQDKKHKDYLGGEAEKSTSVSDGDEFPLKIKMLDGKVFSVNITIKDYMGKLKDKISDIEGIPKAEQILVYAGRIYRSPSTDMVTIEQAGIYPGPFLQPVILKRAV